MTEQVVPSPADVLMGLKEQFGDETHSRM